MITQYLKQALFLLKDNKLLSAISILGTALSIAMIMCIVLIGRVRTANYEPEVYRDRTLSTGFAIARNKVEEGWNSGGRLSLRVIKECFYPLESAEAVTAIWPGNTRLAASPGLANETKCTMSGTDDTFWRMYRFRFLKGKPYGEEYVSGVKTAVVSRSLARYIFGTDDVVGRTLSLSYVDYTICGVVEDVSVLAENAYADVWVPYPSMENYDQSSTDGLLASYICQILAPAAADIETVRQEAIANIDKLNANQKDFKLMLFGAPDSRLMQLARDNMWKEPSVGKWLLTLGVVVFILLLVPAINLSGITLSRMRRRIEEIGVRRAFGSTRGELLRQILSENFVVTLMGGFVGLVFSYIGVLALREWLLNTMMSGYYGVSTAIHSGMIVNWDVFVFALLFCLMLNLLSAGIPAWRISRTHIVNALNK